MSEGE
jgi:Ca2+-binding EF-hand superfamily protein